MMTVEVAAREEHIARSLAVPIHVTISLMPRTLGIALPKISRFDALSPFESVASKSWTLFKTSYVTW